MDRVERKHRFHILGLAHLPVSERYNSCAFTQKIVKLSKMLLSLGHETIIYGAETSDAPCTEFVETHTIADIRQEWGSGDNRPQCDGLGYPWRETSFRHDFNKPRTATTAKYYKNASKHVLENMKHDDFMLVMQGVYQKPIADAAGLFLTCEPGIGYRGSYARFRAFESAYLQNFTYGSEHPGESINGHYYDRVIPNYFDEKDFPFQEKKEDYFLYVGRMILRKGVETAIKATGHIGAKLILAGQLSGEWDDIDVNNLPGHCEFIGHIDPDERATLMGGARAVFVPTQYLEAFGGVNVEAQLTGAPVITTNYGVFSETVLDNRTGFLCNTLDDFVWAAKNAHTLDPKVIRKHAERYLMDNVRWEFQRFFDDIYDVYESAQNDDVMGWNRVRDFTPAWRKSLYMNH